MDHDVCAGVLHVTKDFIDEAANEEWLANIKDELMGITNKIPIKMLDHLYNKEGTRYTTATIIKLRRTMMHRGTQ